MATSPARRIGDKHFLRACAAAELESVEVPRELLQATGLGIQLHPPAPEDEKDISSPHLEQVGLDAHVSQTRDVNGHCSSDAVLVCEAMMEPGGQSNSVLHHADDLISEARWLRQQIQGGFSMLLVTTQNG